MTGRLTLANRLARLWQDWQTARGRWLSPVLPAAGPLTALGLFRRYLADYRAYNALVKAGQLHGKSGAAPGEPAGLADSYPCLFDRTSVTGFDAHYLYQAVWAIKHVTCLQPAYHVDIGSDHRVVALLTVQVPVVFIDIRPLRFNLRGYQGLAGDILALPFQDCSLHSLSCLHVAEHIGLGRYGDALNPQGTRQACAEMQRVLAPGGSLFFSLPVGRPRLCFNAHRVHSPGQILNYFQGLELVAFSAVDDAGMYRENISPVDVEQAEYACGLFWFRRQAGDDFRLVGHTLAQPGSQPGR